MNTKVIWIDTETTSLDPKVASIRELAYVAEIDGHQIGEIQALEVQPILHFEDLVYGDQDIHTFVADYNKKFHKKDLDQLAVYSIDESNPLFFYAKAVLTFNVDAPHILDPKDWLLGNKLSTYKALMTLNEYITTITDIPGRWLIAGHNVKYDLDVITNCAYRILGKDGAYKFLNNFNKYALLDTLSLARWFMYSGRLKTAKANLTAVAKELGIDVSNMHNASADVFAAKEISRLLLNKDK
jgi:DNA polymerase III epsilon subunit-like protein